MNHLRLRTREVLRKGVRILGSYYSSLLNRMCPNVLHRSAALDTLCHPDTPPYHDNHLDREKYTIRALLKGH